MTLNNLTIMMELVTVVLLTEKAAIRHAIPLKCAATKSDFGQCSEILHLFGPQLSSESCTLSSAVLLFTRAVAYLSSVFRG